MDDLDFASLRRLRAFLAVCDSLHFGRAAEQLGIAQPALSQQIKGLEAGLGARLFNRRRRGIDLTAAGEAYRIEAGQMMAMHRTSIEKVRRTARGELGALSIGYTASAIFDGAFPQLLKRFHEGYPDIDISLIEGGIDMVCDAVEAADVDIALVRAPFPLPSTVTHAVASTQRLIVALPTPHRLAGMGSLSLQALAHEPHVSFKDPADMGITSVLSDLAASMGITLRVEWRVSALTSVIGLVAAGLGYGIVPEGLGRIDFPGVCFRPLDDEGAKADLWYIWRPDRVSPALAKFLSLSSDGRSSNI